VDPSESQFSEKNVCAICRRGGLPLTKHHLIPRTTHKRKRIAKQFSAEERCETVPLCRSCHSQVHATFNEMELAEQYNTLDKLMAHEEIARYAKWATRQRGKITVRGKR
jgi:hypothetical protein